MSIQNADVIRVIHFYENKAVERRMNNNANIVERKKEDILENIQNKINQNIIKNYTIHGDKNVVVYRMMQEEGIVQIHMLPTDECNGKLKSILESKKERNFSDMGQELKEKASKEIFEPLKDTVSALFPNVGTKIPKKNTYSDDITILFLGGTYRMTSKRTSEEVTGQSMEGVRELIQCKPQIESGMKDGTDTIRYVFFLKGNKRIRVYVRNLDKEIIEQLDKIANIKIKKKNKLKLKDVLGVGVGVVLTAGVIFATPVVKDFMISQKESMEKTEQIENNMHLINSYHTRLGNYAYGLDSDDFSKFEHLVKETLLMVDESDLSYSFLQQCLEEIDNAYRSSPTSRYKTR